MSRPLNVPDVGAREICIEAAMKQATTKTSQQLLTEFERENKPNQRSAKHTAFQQKERRSLIVMSQKACLAIIATSGTTRQLFIRCVNIPKKQMCNISALLQECTQRSKSSARTSADSTISLSTKTSELRCLARKNVSK